MRPDSESDGRRRRRRGSRRLATPSLTRPSPSRNGRPRAAASLTSPPSSRPGLRSTPRAARTRVAVAAEAGGRRAAAAAGAEARALLLHRRVAAVGHRGHERSGPGRPRLLRSRRTAESRSESAADDADQQDAERLPSPVDDRAHRHRQAERHVCSRPQGQRERRRRARDEQTMSMKPDGPRR